MYLSGSFGEPVSVESKRARDLLGVVPMKSKDRKQRKVRTVFRKCSGNCERKIHKKKD